MPVDIKNLKERINELANILHFIDENDRTGKNLIILRILYLNENFVKDIAIIINFYYNSNVGA